MRGQLKTSGLRSMTYDTALERWEKAKPWRGEKGEYQERPIVHNNRRRHMTIRKDRNEHIVCRLYNTDVVEYHPDGAVTLRAWGSMTTDKFANAVLPAGIHTMFNASPSMVCVDDCTKARANGWHWSNRRAYLVDNKMTFARNDDGDFRPVDESEIEPFRFVSIDTKKARALLAGTDYKQFAGFALVYRALNGPSEHAYFSESNIKAWMAEGPEGWKKIIGAVEGRPVSSAFGNSSRRKEAPIGHAALLNNVRLALYYNEDVCQIEERPFLYYPEVDNYNKQRAKLSWAR